VSDEHGIQDSEDSATGPRPEPLRFFGTTWVDHSNGYTLRRVGLSVGSLAAAALSCLILRYAYEGLRIAEIGNLVTTLAVVMFTVCSAIAFSHTWESFNRRPDTDRQASLRGLLLIGFIGTLLAWFFRSLKEAPGEKRAREAYETAVRRHESRIARRSGNPARRRRKSASR
jgi:hypothetical protein